MKKGKPVNFTLGISSMTRLLILCGIGLFFSSYLPFTEVCILAPAASFISSVASNLGLTCISAGLVSVIVEISSIKSVIKDALLKVLSGEIPYQNMSLERLKDVRDQVAAARCENEKMDVSQLKDSAYILEDELLAASKGMYYEYNKAKFVIDHEKAKQIFHKKVEFSYQIINRFCAENKVSLHITVIHPSDKMTKEELLRKFKIKAFKLQQDKKKEMDLTEVARDFLDVKSIEQHSHSLYKYEIVFCYPLDSKVVSNKVILYYEYDIPDYDIVQSYKINYPSKVLEHTFYIDGDEQKWELVGDAYTAFYFPPTDKEYEVSQSVYNSININFRDWALTGAGYMVTFKRK